MSSGEIVTLSDLAQVEDGGADARLYHRSFELRPSIHVATGGISARATVGIIPLPKGFSAEIAELDIGVFRNFRLSADAGVDFTSWSAVGDGLQRIIAVPGASIGRLAGEGGPSGIRHAEVYVTQFNLGAGIDLSVGEIFGARGGLLRVYDSANKMRAGLLDFNISVGANTKVAASVRLSYSSVSMIADGFHGAMMVTGPGGPIAVIE